VDALLAKQGTELRQGSVRNGYQVLLPEEAARPMVEELKQNRVPRAQITKRGRSLNVEGGVPLARQNASTEPQRRMLLIFQQPPVAAAEAAQAAPTP
jgi:hypothetical protein